jgi:hypothetical protein
MVTPKKVKSEGSINRGPQAPKVIPQGALTANTDEKIRDWVTRNEATDMLWCSAQTLVNYERKGVLHPQHDYRRDERGAQHRVVVYSPHELSKLAHKLHRPVFPRDPGEIAGRAYEMLDEGRSEREIVRELRLTPDATRVLHDKWLDGGGADRVLTTSAWETLEGVIGPFKSVTELVEHVIQLKSLEGVAGSFKNIAELVVHVAQLKKLEKVIGPFNGIAELVECVTQLKSL